MIRLALANVFQSTVKPDRESGVISGVAVITAGLEAHGHNAPPFITDSVLLKQVADAINAQPNGVKCRMGHAEVEGTDGLHTIVGKVRNARVDGNVVRADFYAGKGADRAAVERLFWLAEDAPEDAGLSIIPNEYEFIEENGEVHLRVSSMFAVDWVGVPAANPAGMLSKSQGKTPGKAIAMKLNAAQTAFLKNAGLADGATEEDTQKFIDGMAPEMKAKFSALMDQEPVEPVTPPAANAAPAAPAAPAASAAAAPQPALARPAGPVAASLTEINEIAQLAGLSGDWVVEMALNSRTAEDVKKLALAAKAKGKEPMPIITVGDNLDRVSLQQAIPDAIMLRAGFNLKNRHDRANQLASLSVLDMARHHYAALGVREAFMLSRSEICNLIAPRYFAKKYPALAGAQGSSSFDNILADTINKTLLVSYAESSSTWQKWAKRGTTPDFKLTRRVGTFDLPVLTERKEGEGLDYVTVGDRGESFYMKEFHGGVRITRVALINDDLNALSDVTRKMGKAARSIEDDAAYNQLSGTGRTMADTGALFNATAATTAGGHANYTSSGTAISTTSLSVGFGQMFVQRGVATGSGWTNGRALELRPKYLIVASQIEYIARQAISSTELLTSEALTSAGVMKGTSNPFKDSVEVIPTTRLATAIDGSTMSSTAWVLAADPSEIDTVEVTFLQGEEQPVLTQESDFDTDDMKFKVRHACVATALDHRGLYKNVGA